MKVARASEAISKFGSSTYLKNNSKLVDSNTYLKEHYKIKMYEEIKLICHKKIKNVNYSLCLKKIFCNKIIVLIVMFPSNWNSTSNQNGIITRVSATLLTTASLRRWSLFPSALYNITAASLHQSIFCTTTYLLPLPTSLFLSFCPQTHFKKCNDRMKITNTRTLSVPFEPYLSAQPLHLSCYFII